MDIKEFWRRFRFKNFFLVLSLVTFLFLLWRFTLNRQYGRVCNTVLVQIDNAQDNHFIDENDILNLLSSGQSEPITGRRLSDLDLPVLEKNLYKNRFVAGAQVWTDVGGNLVVRVAQARPIGRILGLYGRDSYIGSEGELLPISGRYTARVPVLSGVGASRFAVDTLLKTTEGLALIQLLKHIHADTFWQMMICQIEIDKNGQILLYPQIGKQIIEFGRIDDIEIKFYKLMLFYKNIIPKKGWNTYSRIKIKFDGQIICES